MLTSDGKPYGPWRFKEITEERYLITKYTHTSYSDTGEMTPIERDYVLNFIIKDLQRENEIRQKAVNQK